MTIDRYITEQPAVLTAVLRETPAQLANLPRLELNETIYLVGTGSSMNALIAATPTFERLLPNPIRLRSPLAFSEDAAAGPLRPGLAILLSQTGTSSTVIDALNAARSAGLRTIGVTAEQGSPFGQVIESRLIMPVGGERVGPKTKGYTASVLSLLMLAHALAGEKAGQPDLSDLAAGIEQARTAAADMTEAFSDADFFLVLGRGRHAGTALEASLKIAEMTGIPAAGYDTEEAFHGRLHGLTPRSVVFLLSSTAKDRELAAIAGRVLGELGVAARIFDLPAAAVLPEFDLIAGILPFQWLGRELALRKSIAPEVMRYPGLSQRLKIKTGDEP